MRTSTALCIASLALLAASARAAQVGPETVLPASPLPAHEPHVAFGGGKHLAVWQSGKADSADIYGCRLDASGRSLDAKPFVISKAVECQERPRAAWGGKNWLVVWADLRNDKDYDVYAARVSADGKALDADGVLIAGGAHNQCQPDVAFNGQNFLVVWRSFDKGKYWGFGARVSPEGRLLDRGALKIGEEKPYNVSVGEMEVASAGGQWLVAWVSRGSSLINPAGGGGRAGLRASIVTADGKITMVNVLDNHGMDRVMAPVTLASNGKDGYLISWRNGTTGGRSGTHHGQPFGALRVDLAGKQLGTTELGGKEVLILQPQAAWDGKGYHVVYWHGHRRDPNRGYQKHTNKIISHLVAADGKYEGKAEVSSGDPHPGYQPAAAGDGKGSCLVVYEKHPAKAGDTIHVAARLVKR